MYRIPIQALPPKTTINRIIHIDMETYYDRKYSLSKMPTILYVRDERFKVLGVSVAIEDEPHKFMSHEEFADFALQVDWKHTAVSAYNCAFDACVLTQIYNVFPAYYLCPQSAARGLIPTDKHNLRTIAPMLGLGEKGDALVEGSHEVSQELIDYANNDNELCRGVLHILYPLLSSKEVRLIHETVKKAVEPVIPLDVELLNKVVGDAISEREALIAKSGHAEADLVSNPKFRRIIKSLGLEAPKKISAKTGEETDAFAKGDDEFVSFMGNNPEYSHIWDARLAAKSNILISRPKWMLKIAETGTMPFPLKYCGAHTGRASGTDMLNVQNFPGLHKSDIRKSIQAPPGMVIVVADSSQIELRKNMWFCGQKDKLELLRSGGDIYLAEAASQYKVPEEEVTKMQRQYGKVVQLGMGYGMGATRFQKYCAAGPLGMDPMYLSDHEAYSTVQTYRSGNPMIPATWKALDKIIPLMSSKLTEDVPVPGYDCLRISHESITLPSGRELCYPGLHYNGDSWVYNIGKNVKFLWGGSLLENIIQAMARDIVMYQEIEIADRYRVISDTHDEIIFLAPENRAEDALQFALDVMSVSPWWAPDLPLSAEGTFAKYYAKP